MRQVIERSSMGACACDALLEAARSAIAQRGAFVVALSGGSIVDLLANPLRAAVGSANFECWCGTAGLPLLAAVQPNRTWVQATISPFFALPSDVRHVFLADERYVKEEHADSNLGT